MNKHIRHLAAAIFFISFLLPAIKTTTGWTCFYFCSVALAGKESMTAHDIYLFGFFVVNLSFLFMWLIRPVNIRFKLVFAFLSLVSIAYVASLQINNLLETNRIEILSISYGYYVWLLSFILLSISLFAESLKK